MIKGSSVALVTPFTINESIDYSAVAQLIDWHVEQGTKAIVVAGTTGESATLAKEEVIELATFSAKHSNGRIKIIAGNGTNCTKSAVALTQALNNTGIDGLLTVTPYYNKPTEQGLYDHYKAIHDASRLPITLYNVPSRTACDMSVELVARLSELKQVVAIKDATGELKRVRELRDNCPEDFILLSGDDVSGTEFCKLGGDGVISVTANVVPKQMAQIQKLINKKEFQQAQLLDETLAQLHKDLFVESNPIPVKWALKYVKRISNAKLRLPLTELSSVGQSKITKALNDLTHNFQEY
ncbi:4-hydroxy-tetrahydrodipicolinate synthase [Thalassotalea sp. M1531]|uniref:4-hydroxy-tetrahydrodipicolinate synthase n=1 Tax=Thalassotalea algicola TaxID=2716224 RepID=A0A7Y0LDC4_9GAMM|nr:4-hydroxy-tetrahydrodipicolinate synthase [Thalassotalea algicola]NMP32475.1 4-hydroxy-tetrahydrodipicolinate synthase [Thalassotalea algicola]